ncbi:hypothetical protein C0J52_00877 [Blattella germanica]|nr:hypothetical protein C0J52_00877 [Blattella germanica]
MLLKLRERSKRDGSVYMGSLGSSKVLPFCKMDRSPPSWDSAEQPAGLVEMLEEKLFKREQHAMH